MELTGETQQQREVGVLSLSPLSQNAAQGAQVAKAGGDLGEQPLRELSSCWLEDGRRLVGALLLWIVHLLLERQILLHQLLILGRQLQQPSRKQSGAVSMFHTLREVQLTCFMATWSSNTLCSLADISSLRAWELPSS